ARAADPEQPKSAILQVIYRIRFRYFVVLVTVLVAALALTLPRVPYPHPTDGRPDVPVKVTGHQWYWDIKPQGDGSLAHTEGTVVYLAKDALVEFQVTAADVNHGFGLYDEAGHLLAQTQAMPAYVNRLLYRFTRPGTYRILCLEYCGIAHHAMTSTIEVGGESNTTQDTAP
ncbi:MAG TPA: hypothetical protein VE175_02895, partial [Woeseiaceae bacterium]|nr:hypothetical protein [Woeseiaceae bacterium]